MQTKRTSTSRRGKRLLQKLEDRVLFSASPLQEAPVPDPIATDAISDAAFESQHQLPDIDAGDEFVFVDQGVDTSDELVRDLLNNLGEHQHIVLLDANREGLTQIAEALRGKNDLAAIHLLSHGGDGQLHLGTSDINSVSLPRFAAQLNEIGAALASDGDLLIYGCNLAASEDGREFVEQLSELTSADVAASTDLTGAAELDGDWDLEIQTGGVETASVEATGWLGTLSGPADVTWVLGNNGTKIDFNGATPAISDTPATIIHEGFASWSDPGTGELLLYSNGETVWNGQTNNVLQNGSGLSGDSSDVQPVAIVPVPGERGQFYLFHISYFSVGILDYSVVDMGVGTDGAVTVKNQRIDVFEEALDVIPHANGEDFWVLAYDRTSTHLTIAATRFDATGEREVVTSDTALTFYSGGAESSFISHSSDNSKLLLGQIRHGDLATADFDAATGLLSNSILHVTGGEAGYAAAFSPDATKFYYTVGGSGSNGTPHQFDLLTDTVTQLSTETGHGGPGLGPDGKVYFARNNDTALSVVSDPNVAGIGANFAFRGFDLTDGGANPTGRSGLNLFNQVAVQPSFANGPSLTLDGSNFGGLSTDVGLTSTANVPLVTPSASISDPDSTELVSFEVQITGVVDGDNEVLNMGGRAIPLGTNATHVSDIFGGTTFAMTFDTGTGILSIANNAGGDMPIGDAELLLRTASYDRIGPISAAQRLFRFVVNDGSINSTAPTHLVSIGFQHVNTEDGGTNIQNPRVAALTGGNYVVVWDSFRFGGSTNWEVAGQMFDNAGSKVGSNFVVSQFTDSTQRDIEVQALQDGGFATVFTTSSGFDGDPTSDGISIRFFDATGAPRTGETTVNTFTSSLQRESSLTQLADGRVVVTWTSSEADGSRYAISGQILDTLGAKIGSEFQVNSTTDFNQTFSTVSSLASGGFVVVWQDQLNDVESDGTSSYGVFGQVYDASGNRVGAQIHVNETINGIQRGPDVVPLHDGFVVTWEGAGAGDTAGVLYRRFDASGTAIGDEYRANSIASATQDASGIIPLADGGFYTFWDDINAVEGRRFNANGFPIDVTDVAIDSSLETRYSYPDVSQLPNGNFVATYINLANEIFAREILQSGTPTTIDGLSDLNEPLNRRRYATLGTPLKIDEAGTSTVSNFTPTAGPYRLDVNLFNGDTANDSITLENQGTGPGQIGVSGANVTYEGIVIGTLTNSVLGSTVSSVLDFTATPTTPMLEALIHAITFSAADPGTGNDFGVREVQVSLVENGFVLNRDTVEVAVTPLDQEFLVNTSMIALEQVNTDSTKLANGNYVVSWQDDVADGDGTATMAHIYGQDGIEVTEPIFLATHSRDAAQENVKIAALDTGGFVAAWQTQTIDDADTTEAIAAQIFAANGDPVGAEIRVNTTLADAQLKPDVAGLSGGQFIVVWEGTTGADVDGIAGQVFDAAGNRVGGELTINSATVGLQQDARVEKLSDGNAVVVWSSGDDIAFRRFGATGNALDSVEQVATAAAGVQSNPAVVSYADGFAIAWHGEGADDADGVYVQRFNNAGNVTGAATLVNQTTTAAQEFVELAANDQLIGVVWSGNGTTGTTDDNGIWFRAFAQSGAFVSDETPINPVTSGIESKGTLVGGRTMSEFFFAWQTDHGVLDNSTKADVFGNGIVARITTVAIDGLIDLDADDDSGATGLDFDTAFMEGNAPSKLADTDVLIVDVNGGAYNSLDLIVAGVVDANNEFLHLGGQVFDLSTDVVVPQTVTVNLVDYDVTYDRGTGAFSIALNGGGTMSVAELNSVINDLAYSNSLVPPTEGTRPITWTADEGGATTLIATTNMDVWQFNEAPIISADALTPYTQAAAAVVVDPLVTITDIDDTVMHGAVVTVADVDRATDGLALTVAANTAASIAGITMTPYNSANGQLRLSGAASIADYKTVLEGVEFSSLSATPGNRTIEFVIEDQRNSSAPSVATIVYSVDTTPPPPPTVPIDLLATSDMGLFDDDNVTNVTTPELAIPAGIGTPGDTVTIFFDGLTFGTTTVLADGSALYTPTGAADGTYDVTYRFTDPAGNESEQSPGMTLTIDTVAPTGSNSVFGYAANTSTPRIRGAAYTDTNEYFVVELHGEFYDLGSVNGIWNFDVPPANALADGSYTVFARIHDLAGNAKLNTGGMSVDTIPPVIPTVDSLVTADQFPQLSGTVTIGPGEDFRVTVDSRTYYHTWSILNVVGNTWTLDIDRPIEPDGVYEVVARVRDLAYNESYDTTVGELTVDLLEPAIPTVNALTTNDTTPAVTGTSILETGESLEVTINGVTYSSLLGEISFSGSSWTVVVPTALAEGTYEVAAFATDGAGNNSTDATTDELTIDTTLPAIPTVTSQLSADTTPLITGTATVATGETLQVRVDGITYSLGSNLILTGTNWALQVPNAFEITPSGTYEVVATVTDQAGNVATDATTGEFVLDMLDPPTVDTLATNDTTPAITGSVSINQAFGETLDVTVNGTTYNLGGGNLGITGSTWTLTVPTGSELLDGIYDVVAVVSDLDGNSASDASLNELTIDTVVPATPTANSQTTADSTPLLTGTATVGPLEDLRVVFNGRTYFDWQSALTLTGTDWALQIPAGHELTTNGIYEIQATVLDPAGNQATDTTIGELVYDTLAPDVPTVDSLATNDDTPAITGIATLGPDETLSVEVDGVTYHLGDGDLGITGSTWTLTVPTGNELSDGTYEVVATATDDANNSTTDTTFSELKIDTVSPAVPAVNPQVTNDSTPFMTGTAVVNADETLTVRVNGVTYPDFGSDLTVAGTNWSLQIPVTFEFTADGVYEVIARVTDEAGNATTDTTTGEFTYDTVLPDAPVVDTLSVNDSTPAISGTANLAPDETLSVAVDGVTYNLGDGNLGMSGSVWTLVVPTGNELTDGLYEVVAMVTDSIGNANTDGSTNELTIDTVPPAVPTVNAQITNDPAPLITGTATVGTGEELSVNVNGFTYYDWMTHLTVAGTNWSLQIPSLFEFTANGVYEVEAKVTDSAGNETTDTTLGEFTYDTVLPDAPVVTPLASNDTTPAISGTANLAADETLAVEVNGVTYNQGDGNLGLSGSTWTLVIPTGSELLEGTYEVVATVTDSIGNTNNDATTNELTIDLTPPAVPTVNSLISNDATPFLTGTATVGAGEATTVRVNGVTYFIGDSHLTLAGTNWSLQIPTIHEFTANGVYEVEATVTDLAANATTDTTLAEFTYDTVLPDAPVVDLLPTNDTTPAITGTANLLADETLAVEVNGVTYNQGDGNLGLSGSTWTLVIPTGNELPEGTYEVIATATDSIGNTNSDATTNELVVDLTPPAVPTVDVLISNDPTPLLTGTAIVQTDEELLVVVNGVTYHDFEVELAVTGTNWSLQIPTIFEFTADGVYEVEATVLDLVTNASTDTTLGEFTFDTALPDAPVVDSLATNDSTPPITGTANLAADETLAVEVNGVTYNLGDGNLGMTGSTWTLVVPTGNELLEGTYDVHATVTDSIGNTNNDATSGELFVDLTPPAVPTVNLQISNDPTPILTGTATVAPDELFTIRVNGVTYFEAGPHLALAGTNWSLQVPTIGEFTSDGVYEVEATVTDPVNNASTDTTLGEFTYDTVLPDAPVVNPLATNDTTPAISGTANLLADEVLSVLVDGVSYTLGDGNLGMTGSTWTLVIPTGNELVEGTYDVHATVTDSIGNTNNDATSAELVVDLTPPATPTVDSLISNDPTPLLTGTAVVGPDETLSVHVNGITYFDVDSHLTLAGTNWSLQIPTISEFSANGVYEVEATTTDLAGNATTDNTLGEFTFDTVLPDAPVVNPLATNDTTPTISGTANLLADEVLTVEVNGVTYAVGDGNLSMTGSTWTLVIPTGSELPEATYDVNARVTDSIGNTNNDATSAELVIDLTPPAVPTVNTLVSNDPTPFLTGTAIVGTDETLTIEANGITYSDGDTHLSLSGTNWSLQIPTVFEYTTDGTYDIQATVTDLAGNATADVTLGEYTFDTTLPSAPVVNPLITNDTSPAISGVVNLVADETLAVEVNGVIYNLGDGDLGMTGSTWTLVIPAGNELLEGTYDVHATVTDSIGNSNNDTTSNELLIDLTPPDVPTVNSLISNDPTPFLTGTANVASGETLSVRVNGVTYLDGDSHLTLAGPNWSLQIPTIFEFTADGVYEVEATVTDLAGNVATDTTLGEFTLDTVLPDAPVVNSQVTNNVTPAVTGTANLAADESLQVTVDGVNYTLGDGDLSMTGSDWTLLIPTGNELAEGTHEVHATVTDSIGNTNSDATTNELLIDLTPPAIPSANTLVSNDATPTLTGSAIVGPGETLQVELNGRTYVAGDGHLTRAGSGWSLQVPTSSEFTIDGTYDVVVTVSDPAGNVSTDPTTGEFTYDTVPPDAPTVTPLITNNVAPTITGTANLLADETLTVTVDGNSYALGDGNLSIAGSAWTLLIPVGDELPEGTYDVLATASDSLGNANSDTTINELNIDLTPPIVPTVNSMATNDSTPLLSGTAIVAIDETLTVQVNGITHSVGDGHLTTAGPIWSLQVSTAGELTSAGIYEVTATITDVAGNASTDVTVGELEYDPTLPDAPTVHPQATNNATPTITGTATLAAGETLSVEIDGVTYSVGSDLTTVGTDWSLTIPAGQPLTDGTYDVHAVVTDSVGNANNDTTSNELLVDLTPPAVPTVDSAVSTDPTPLLTGTAVLAPGDSLTVDFDGNTYTMGDGNLSIVGSDWSLQIPATEALGADGAYDVTASVADFVGNVSVDPTAAEYVLDTQPPTQPTVDTLVANDATPLLSGTATLLAGETMTVDANGILYSIGDGNLAITGNAWSLQIPSSNPFPSPGSYDITATATDGLGNSITDGTLDEFTFSSGLPAPPTVDDLVTNDATPILTGTALLAVDESLAVAVNGVSYAVGDGNLSVVGNDWELQVPDTDTLPGDGAYEVTATVTDSLGHVATDLTSDELTLDTAAPVAPTVNTLATNSSTPTITGTASVAANEFLSVTVDGVTYIEGDGHLVLSGSTSTWSLSIPTANALPEGQIDVAATVTDSLGNSASDSTTNELFIDTTPPSIPSVTSLASNDSTPVITGTAIVNTGEVLTVTTNGVTYVASDGNLTLVGTDWMLQIPSTHAFPADGTYEVTANVTDSVGNVSSDVTSGEFVLDSSLPNVPTVDFQLTNDPTPTISGTATLAAGESLSVSVDGVTYVEGDGTLSLIGTDWTLAMPPTQSLNDGTVEITATITNGSGANSDTTTNELSIDMTPPVTPTIDTVTTTSTEPAITGTATLAAGETLSVTVDGSTYVEGDGNLTRIGSIWTLQVPATNSLAAGSYDVTATATDAAGNVAVDTTVNELTVGSVGSVGGGTLPPLFVFDSVNDFANDFRIPDADIFPQDDDHSQDVADRIRVDAAAPNAGRRFHSLNSGLVGFLPTASQPRLTTIVGSDQLYNGTTVFDSLRPISERLSEPFDGDRSRVFKLPSEAGRAQRLFDPRIRTSSYFLQLFTVDANANESLEQLHSLNNRPLQFGLEPLRSF